MIISFEGIDGSGKSTQAGRLATRLQATGRECIFVREPGGTELSERVRELLLDPSLEIDAFAEMLLFSAARAQLVRQKLDLVSKRGGIVVCDRFLDSTIAYQGGGRGVADMDWLADFQRRVTGGLLPDRTYLIRIDPDLASRRLTARDTEKRADRMEQAGRAFFERVSRAYDQMAEAEPKRFRVIDGSGTIGEIEQTIWTDLESLL